MSTKPEIIVQFEGVEKTYDGRTNVVDCLDLDIYKGEFLTLLGPSGSGKTTILLMLAGFEATTAGDITLNNQSLHKVPPFKRDCPSSNDLGHMILFSMGGSGSSRFDVMPLVVDGSSGGFGWSVS